MLLVQLPALVAIHQCHHGIDVEFVAGPGAFLILFSLPVKIQLQRQMTISGVIVLPLTEN